MAVICTIRDYIIAQKVGSPGVYWYWDKDLKTLLSRPYASVTDFFELNEGSVIDVIAASGLVAVVTKGSDPIYPINFVQLFSTSGDPYNTLLSATVLDGVLTVVMYSTTAKETTTITFPMQVTDNDSPANDFTPCFNDYEIADDIILTSWCDSFTLNEVKTLDGEAVVIQTANSVTCGYQIPLEPFRISKEIEIEYRDCVLSNPVYFVWKNTLGGWDYWLFQKNQTEHIDVTTLGSFQKNYNVISDINNPETERGKNAVPRIIFGADNLTLQQKIGIQEILLSNKVYILNQDGSVNREVKVLPGSFLVQETEKNLHEIEFEILDVEINTIRN